MSDVVKLKEMSKALRDSADALDEVVAATEAEDEALIEAAMGKFVMKMLRLQALQE